MPIIKLKIKRKWFSYTKRIDLPESWEELTSKQILNIVPYLQKDMEVHRNLILRELIGVKLFETIPYSQLIEFTKHLNWLFNTPFSYPVMDRFKHGPKYKTIKIFLAGYKTFRVPGKQEYVLPGRFFFNVKMKELIYGFASLTQWFNTKQELHLETAIASLCRPPKKNYNPSDPENGSDEREAYNYEFAAQRSALMQDLPSNMKLLILTYYMGCMDHIVSMHPGVFEEEKKKANESEDEKLENEKESSEVNPWVWLDFARSLTVVKKLGTTIDEVQDKYFHNVLIEAAKSKAEHRAKQIERKMAKAAQNARS